MLVTGTASAVYSGVKQFYIPTDFLTSGAVISSLNGLTVGTQLFSVGTTGSDFNISSSLSTHVFNLPTASGSVRGALSASDWSAFNAKQYALVDSAGLRSALSDETGGGSAVFGTGPLLDLPRINVYAIGSTLPAAGTSNRIALVTNGSTGSDCVAGGGSFIVLCVDTGSIWTHPGSGIGLTSLNSQTGATQSFSTGSTGVDFTISSSSNVHTFLLPSSSASARGLLTPADWSTFNAKESALTFSTPLSRSTNTVSCPTCLVSTGSYPDPPWITSVAWSKVATAPIVATSGGVRLASTDTVYMGSANPYFSFNAEYDGGWKYGNASPNNYAFVYTRDGNGNMIFASAPTGTSGAAITFDRQWYLMRSGMLAIGGTTSSFPGIDASGAIVRVRLADGSAFARLQAAAASAQNDVVTLNSSGQVDISLMPVASQAEAEAGSLSTNLMTPQRVAQAIEALADNTNSGAGAEIGKTGGRVLRSVLSDDGTMAITQATDEVIVNLNLSSPNTWVAGAKQVFTPSATVAGFAALCAALPSSPANGDYACDSGDSNRVKVYTNGAWLTLSAALADPGSNGIVARTALNTTAARTITGTANEVAVSNGDGVSGNPTISLPSTVDIGSKTTLTHQRGTSLPGTCTVGESYQKTDATAASQWYLCTSTNTWTAQGSGSSYTFTDLLQNSSGTVRFMPWDPSVYFVRDDFLGSNTGANAIGQLSWTNSTIAGGVTITKQSGTWPYNRMARVAVTTGTTGNGGTLLLPDPVPWGAHTGDTVQHWVWVFKLGTASNIRSRIGLFENITNATGSNGVGLRCDTSAGDTNFMFVNTLAASDGTSGAAPTSSGVTCDTNTHVFHLYTDGSTSAKWYFQLDNGTPRCVAASGCDITATPSTGSLYPLISVMTDENSATNKHIDTDFFAGYAKLNATVGLR